MVAGPKLLDAADSATWETINDDVAPCGGPGRIAVQSCEGPCLHSRDDLDRNADLKTELAIRAPLINGDFGKSVRIFVPECRDAFEVAVRCTILGRVGVVNAKGGYLRLG
jgi:hypothetical protein